MDTSKYANSTISVENSGSGEVSRPLIDEPERAAQLAEMMKALAHPIRLRIVALLSTRGKEYVNRLAADLGLKQAIISQQLSILRNRGLVEAVRENGFAYYRLTEPQLEQMVRCMEGCSIPPAPR
jgi:DNA-binding transcriptional ArsR family regulator